MTETLNVSASDLVAGMGVFDSDGKKVGVLNEVIENPGKPTSSPWSFYLQVTHGGFLGMGGTHLYIPIQGVKSVKSRIEVMLSCTAEQAEERYRQKPK